MEGQTVSFTFKQMQSCSAKPANKMSKHLSQVNVLTKLLEQKCYCTVYFQSLGKRLHSNHFTLLLVPIDHTAVNSLWVSYCLLHLIYLIIPSWFSFFKEKSSMYIQVDHKHICILAPLSSLLISSIPPFTPLGLCSCFFILSQPHPSFPIFLSMDWFLFMQGRSRLTDIVSWPRQAKPLSVPDI